MFYEDCSWLANSTAIKLMTICFIFFIKDDQAYRSIFWTALITEKLWLWISYFVGPALPVNSYFQQEFPSLPAAGDQEKSGKDKDASEEAHGPSLRPQSKYMVEILVKLHAVVWNVYLLPIQKKCMNTVLRIHFCNKRTPTNSPPAWKSCNSLLC